MLKEVCDTKELALVSKWLLTSDCFFVCLVYFLLLEVPLIYWWSSVTSMNYGEFVLTILQLCCIFELLGP